MGGARTSARDRSTLIFPRVAFTLLVAIVVVQIGTWRQSGDAPNAVTVVLPLRPSLMREADALTIVDDERPTVPPLDGRSLAAGLAQLERIPALRLEPAQRRELLVRARRLEAQSRAADASMPRAETARAFRTTFMRTTLAMLEALDPAQVAFIAEHNEDLYIEFEASYWKTLAARLAQGDQEDAPPESRTSIP